MNKHLLMASAAGVGLMAASTAVNAASFSNAGVWALPQSPNLYVALVPSGVTATDSTMLLEVTPTASGLSFAYAMPVISNKDQSNVGGTVGSASAPQLAWSNGDPIYIPWVTSAAGNVSGTYSLGSTTAAQMFYIQQVYANGTATSTPKITCDVFFQASLDAGNALKYTVAAARPVNWASSGADINFTAGTGGTATTGYTISSDYWNGGNTGSGTGVFSTLGAKSNFTTYVVPLASVSTILTASQGNVSGFTNATYTSPAAAVNAMLTCSKIGLTRAALTTQALTKIW
jgi:hypothetical protein